MDNRLPEEGFPEHEKEPEATFAIDGVFQTPIASDKAEPTWDIGNLGSWTLSSAKPGHSVEALRAPETDLYWQSLSLFCLPD
jgi:hypothetical protein